jgi:hypothetical protein
MRITTRAAINFRVWSTGSNMPGYMPDEPPYPCASLDQARECLVEDIERDIDDLLDASVAGDDVGIVERLAELVKYCRESGAEDVGVTVGNRHYFLTEDTATGEELESCDCDPCDYEPILDEWISAEELAELERLNFDVEVESVEYKFHQDHDETKILTGDDIVVEDSLGKWYVAKRACGAWIVPRMVIQARTWEDAWGALEDQLPPVPQDELHEAYDMTEAEFAAAIERMDQQRDAGEDVDYPELTDGYSYQSNSTDSGIVETGDMTLEERGEEYHQLRFKVVLG